MNTILRSQLFDKWLSGLREVGARARIVNRIENVRRGTFGDTKSLGGGLWELRVDYGPGYRIYYTRQGDAVVFLLAGGNKSSQSRDISRARMLMEE